MVTGLFFADQMLETGRFSNNLDHFLAEAENQIGVQFVQEFARLLSVSPSGLTTLELADLFRCNDKLGTECADSLSEQPFLIYSIIDHFGTNNST